MIRFVYPSALTALCVCLSACSPAEGGDETKVRESSAPLRILLDEEARRTRPPNRVLPANKDMPGAIDPPNARWQVAKDASKALYGEPGDRPLLTLSCTKGIVSVLRPVPDNDGAKAVLAFVGYRGILRLRVENDGAGWVGSLPADDPHWKAVTGGPFYATVAGGGKVITPGPGPAKRLFDECTEPKPDRGAPTS